jgi:hypothetical protein
MEARAPPERLESTRAHATPRHATPRGHSFISRRSGSPLKMVDFGLAQKLARGQLLTER